jgi:hypothetical protein
MHGTKQSKNHEAKPRTRLVGDGLLVAVDAVTGDGCTAACMLTHAADQINERATRLRQACFVSKCNVRNVRKRTRPVNHVNSGGARGISTTLNTCLYRASRRTASGGWSAIALWPSQSAQTRARRTNADRVLHAAPPQSPQRSWVTRRRPASTEHCTPGRPLPPQ